MPAAASARAVRSASAMQGNVPALDRPAGGPVGRGPDGPGGGRGPGNGGDGASGAGGDEKTTASELSVNKVVAGAGAAIVTAILGSFLGAVGTVLGAALGSIITTVATTLFQRSIERTRTRVTGTTRRLKERTGGRPDGTAVWQAAAQDGGPGGPDGQETVLLDPAAPSTRPSGGRRRRVTRKQVVLGATGAVLAFALAMFLVTGIEWIKGGTITGGGTGTSIGNVVTGGPAEQPRQDDTGAGDPDPTPEPTAPTGEPGATSSDSATPDPSSTSGSESSSETGDPLQDGLDQVLPTPQPESGELQSGQDGSGGSGDGAAGSN